MITVYATKETPFLEAVLWLLATCTCRERVLGRVDCTSKGERNVHFLSLLFILRTASVFSSVLRIRCPVFVTDFL